MEKLLATVETPFTPALKLRRLNTEENHNSDPEITQMFSASPIAIEAVTEKRESDEADSSVSENNSFVSSKKSILKSIKNEMVQPKPLKNFKLNSLE